MITVKELSKSLIGAISAWHPISIARKRNGLTVFTFHEVSDAPSEFLKIYKLCTSIDLFKNQIDWISRRFEIISAQDLLSDRIPTYAAMITFDDGWAGSFAHAVPYLVDNRIPSLHFLNMAIVDGVDPLLPAFVARMEKEEEFIDFAVAAGLGNPYYLSITPQILERYKRQSNTTIDVLSYQGNSVSSATLRDWQDNPFVQLGSHLYQHWNPIVLTPAELSYQYTQNSVLLGQYANSSPLFSIPHGQWDRCFGYANYLLIKQLGAVRIFANCGTVNCDKTNSLLDRINISQETTTPSLLDFTVNRRCMLFGASLQEHANA